MFFRNRDVRQLVNSNPKCSVLGVGSEKNATCSENFIIIDVKTRYGLALLFGFSRVTRNRNETSTSWILFGCPLLLGKIYVYQTLTVVGPP